MYSHTICHSLLTSFSTPEKKDSEKEEKEKRKEKKRELPGFGKCCLSVLLKPWRNKTGPLPWLHRVTYKASRTKGS
jgi:hypothetical protein